jgi:hypothetical protein
MPLKHLQHLQHPPIYFYNIHMKQLQHTSKTSKTLKTYACNMHFHHNISLLRLRITVAMVSIVAMTLWWGTMTSIAPQQHPSNLHTHGVRGTVRSSGGATHSELEQAQWGMERGMAMEGVRHGMEHNAGWGSHTTPDRVCDGEDDSSERTTQSSTRWARAMGIYF